MPALSGKQVLLIDDDPDFRNLARKVLVGDGASFLEADSVAAGLQLAKSHVPHLIITDLNMPQESGFDFLEQYKKIPELRNIPVVVLTRAKDKGSVLKSVQMGAVDYITKPFQSASFIQKVRRALSLGFVRTYRFDEKSRPNIQLTANASIVKASDTGFLVESAIKVASDCNIKLCSTLLDKVQCKEAFTRTSLAPARVSGPGWYLNEVNLVGIDERSARAIRTMLKGA